MAPLSAGRAMLVWTLLAFALAGSAAAAPLATPAGLTAISLDGRVELAWQTTGGASAYNVYRGTSPAAVTTLVTPVGGVATTSFTDTTAVNGTTYYYLVRAVGGGTESGASLTVQSTPSARSCSTGNSVVLENCYPGDSGWGLGYTPSVASGGIEGFATVSSIARGGSVDLKVNSVSGTTFRIEVYRSGYYGGAGGRLYSVIRGVPGVRQPSCVSDSQTGLFDCSNWSVSATLTTTSSWPSGVYLLRLVRDDDDADNHILLVVRDDSSSSDLLYGVPFSTYEAYNNYGGKSLYNFNSTGAATISGSTRAVKVSFDRPFTPPSTSDNDVYTKADFPAVLWLEQQGYDVTYQSNTDMEHNGSQVRNHLAYFSPAHDEYYSAAMRSALQQARDAGVNLFFSGSNEVYWRIRYEASAASGVQDRVLVCYKTIQGGPADPSGIPTTTWRDPAGSNQPENALTGQMYIGDNSSAYFPLVVNAAQGTDRIFRYTGLDTQPAGSSTKIGSALVGWEWDARSSNGVEPPGVKTLATSAVSGNLVQSFGASYTTGSASANMTKYAAASGALVFNTGTNHWAEGLALNAFGIGEPDRRIQQTTVNVLADMSVRPQTPAANITLDSALPAAPTGVSATSTGAGQVQISWASVAGADGYNVYRTLTPRTGGLPLGTRGNATLVAGTTFTDTGLTPNTTYYYVVTTVAGSQQSIASDEVQAKTDQLPPPQVTAQKPVPGATGVSPSTLVRATFSRAMDSTTITSSSFVLTASDSSTIAGSVAYDPVSLTATMTPGLPLQLATTYTASLKATVASADGATLASPVTWSFTTAAQAPAPLTVTATSPPAGAVAVSRSTAVTATFSRAVDPSTLTSSSFTLKAPDGTNVPATLGYDAASAKATLTPTTALLGNATYTARLDGTIAALDGTPLGASTSWSFTTWACPCQLFSSTASPAIQPAGAYELGVKVQVDQPLQLTAIRFYKATGETGSHTGTVWSASGVQLARVAFTGESAAGWQQQALPAPLQLQANTVYVVSVNANSVFAQTVSGLQTQIVSGPLRSVADGQNGVYTTTLGSFPNQSYSSSNYFVDAVVDSSSAGPPAVTSTSPADGATQVALTTKVTAAFSRPIDPTTLTSSSFTLTKAGATGIPASVSYDGTTQVGTLTPASPLDLNTSYTVRIDTTVRGADGTPLAAAVTWNFTTAGCPCSLFSTTATPASQPAGAYELGVKVQVDQPLQLTAIRFYKATGETGSHTGTVWSASGVQLARVAFSGESAAGWQQQALPAPLQLQANTVYVVSVNANSVFAQTISGLQTQVVSGPLHSVADGQNGVYTTTLGSFPDQSYSSSNYFVDVVAQTGSVSPPAVNSTSPLSGASQVATTTKVTATFSRAMDATTITGSSFTLKKPDGSTVAATVSYDDVTNTATLTPTSSLANSVAYTARLDTAIKAADGISLASAVSWSFTTVASLTTLRVNSGGSSYTSSGGNTFVADKYFSGGSTFSSSAAIGNTSDPALYRNERWGSFSYAIPVTNGTYDVRLHFVELYYTSGSCIGKRIFSMDVLDTPTSPDIANLDVCAQAGGANTALVKTIGSINVTDGVLNLKSVYGSADDPEVAAIEVIPSAPSDTQPPTPPAGLAAAGSLGQVSLSWAASTDNVAVTRYDVYRGTSSGFTPSPSNRIAQPTGASYVDTGLAAGTYYYLVQAEDAAGNLSASSNEASATATSDTQPPTPPAGLAAAGSLGQVSLSWAASTDNVAVTRYDVYRSTSSGFTPSPSNRIAQPTGASYVDTGLAAGTYYYLVQAEDAAGNLSASSNEASATAAASSDTTAPTVSITAPAGGTTVSGVVTVTAGASDNVGVFGVQFKLDGAALGGEDTSAPYSATWDTALSAGGSHSLTALARDAAGNTTTSAAVTVTVSNVPVPAGLVAAYSFDQGSGTTVPDASGNNNTGTLANTTWTTSGKYGSALSFNGANSWVTVNGSSSLDLTAGMTLESWVNPSALGSIWRCVIFKEQPGGMVYSLYAHNGSVPIGQINSGGEQNVTGTAAIALNTWTHLAVTFDGSNLRLYVNGALVRTKALTGTIQTSTGVLRIGGNNIWREWFKGTIDEVRVYNRALSQSEIQNDMNVRVGP